MNVEEKSLIERANRHAALADPARLRIVDLLALGDQSPGALQRELQMPSNLLAHHLGVLERAGIILRTRSEGDRRRSYIRMVSDSPDEPGPGAAVTARRIVFVCTGNSARSPLAAALWRKTSRIPATSAGTEPARSTSPGAIATAERHGLSLAGHTPRAITDVITDDDFIITLCDRAHERLLGVALHWSVPNPTRNGTTAAYETAYGQIAHRIERLARNLSATEKPLPTSGRTEP